MARNIQLPNLKNPYAEGGHPASLLGAMMHQERAATKEAKRKAGLAQTKAKYEGMMEEAKAYSADYNSALTEYLKNPGENAEMLPHLNKLEARAISTWSAIVGRDQGDPNKLAKALTEISKIFLDSEQSGRKRDWKETAGSEATRTSIRNELNRNGLTRSYSDDVKDQLIDMILEELRTTSVDSLTSDTERALDAAGGSYLGSLTGGGGLKDFTAAALGSPMDFFYGLGGMTSQGMHAGWQGLKESWTGQPGTPTPAAPWRTLMTPGGQYDAPGGSAMFGKMMGGGASQRAYQQAMAQMNNLTNYSDPAQVDSRASGNNTSFSDFTSSLQRHL